MPARPLRNKKGAVKCRVTSPEKPLEIRLGL